MASLELAIDNTGLLTGAAQARAGLDTVIAKGMATEKSMQSVSQTMSVAGASSQEAFGATKGALQITRGLAAVSDSFVAAANSATGFAGVANVASGLLLNLTKSRDEWRNLSTAMTTATTVSQVVERDMLGVATGVREVVSQSRTATTGLGVLWNVLKANPVTSIALALGTVSTAMQVFSARTKEAKDEYAKLGEEFSRVRLEGQVGPDFGRGGGGARAQIDNLYRLAMQARTGGGASMTVQSLAQTLGVGQADVMRFMAAQGSSDFQSALRGQPVLDVSRILPGQMSMALANPGLFPQLAPSQMQVPPSAIYQMARMQAGSLVGQAGYEEVLSAYQRGSRQPTIDPMSMGPELGPGQQDWQAEQRRRDLDRQRSIEESMRAMDELNAKGRAFGEAIGDAFYNVASGAQTARQAIASLIQDLSRVVTRQAFGQLGEAVTRGFGATAGQAANGSGPPGGGT